MSSPQQENASPNGKQQQPASTIPSFDDKNVTSFRIPVEQKPKRRRNRNRRKSPGPSTSAKTSQTITTQTDEPTSTTTPSGSPTRSGGGGPSSPSSSVTNPSLSLFNVLLRNLSRQVDEIYYHCEATIGMETISMVDKVEGILQRGGTDFAQLKERIKVQSSNNGPLTSDEEPTATKAGISWDVRKSSSSATANSSIVRNSIERMERDAKEEREREKSNQDLPADNAWSKKLKFEAAAALPPPPLRSTSSSPRPTQSPFEPVLKTPRSKSVSLSVTGKSLKIPKVYVDADNNPLPPSGVNNPPTPSTDNELTDTEAIENVWAEAEAWVEKEERKEQEASVLDGLDVEDEGGILEEDETIVEEEVLEEEKPEPPQNLQNPPQAERKESWYSSSDEEDAAPPLPTRTPNAKKLPAPTLNIQTPSYQTRTGGSSAVQTPLSTASNASSTGSSRSFATPAYGNHYTLHDKLSSPERRRPSPAETKAKMDERVEAAALRRAERESAKKLKLAKAAEKIERARNSVEMKNQQTAATLSEKMRQAEEQAQRHLDSIVKKAESENVKVDEIGFINALNEREFEEQLNQKLQETNARINAARERRRLAQKNLSSKNERRRQLTAKVMSERELEREKQQQERWEKLQVRIKAVNERRQMRIAEAAKVAELKKEKMDAALMKRQEMEDLVVQRSAEKEQRRFLADARRSGDHLDMDGEGSSGTPSPLKGNDTMALRKSTGSFDGMPRKSSSFDEVSLQPRSESKSASADGPKVKSVRDSFEEILLSEKDHREGESSSVEHDAALKLLAQLDTGVVALSRDDKKKRRKKVAGVRKKLKTDIEWGGNLLLPSTIILPEKVSSAASKVDKEVSSLPPPSQDGDGLAPTKSTMSDFPKLGSEVEKLVGVVEKAVKDSDPNSDVNIFVVKRCLEALINAEVVTLNHNHRLWWSHTSQVVVDGMTRVVNLLADGLGMQLLFGLGGGAVTVLEAATRTVCHEAHRLMVRRGEVGGGGEKRRSLNAKALQLLKEMLTFGGVDGMEEQTKTRKSDLLRYLVLMPFCEGVCSLLRAAGGNTGEVKNPVIGEGAIPVVEALALFYDGTKRMSPGTLVETMDELCEVEGDSIPIKDKLLEIVGGGLISLVASILPRDQNPNSVGINVEGLELSTLALRALVHIAKLDLRRFQVLCKGEASSGWTGGGGYLEFQYCIGLVLGGVGTKDFDECLFYCLVVIGYYVVGNANNQQRLHWGGEGQTLLSKLSSLPFGFFVDKQKKNVLFPTLVAACLHNDTNKQHIEVDLNPELLGVYLREKIAAFHKGEGGEGWEDAVETSKRIPFKLWESGVKFFG
mmetsp:Transcript_19605/g.40955  ORF Transcript_19605/g.40955 Transcript_19605/m.40955 type:complete len:1330 (+) Transcript_19605:183-4172(+)